MVDVLCNILCLYQHQFPNPSPVSSAYLGRFHNHERAIVSGSDYHMTETHEQLKDLFNRIPRRHTADNVKEIYSILDAYEDLLMTMEADPRYGPKTVPFFEAFDPIRTTIKKSNDPKASKKQKDVLFDEGSGALKDSVEAAMQL